MTDRELVEAASSKAGDGLTNYGAMQLDKLLGNKRGLIQGYINSHHPFKMSETDREKLEKYLKENK